MNAWGWTAHTLTIRPSQEGLPHLQAEGCK